MSPEERIEGAMPLLVPGVRDAPLAPAICLWLSAQWPALLELDDADAQDGAAPGWLGAMKAAAHFRLGNFDAATTQMENATQKGCPAEVVGAMIVAMMHDTLGCAEACLGNEVAAQAAFREALRPFFSRLSDLDLAVRHHQMSSLTGLGLFTTAQGMLEAEHAAVRQDAVPDAARLAVLGSQIDLLGYELALALRRGQVMVTDTPQEAWSEALQRRSTSQLGQDLWVLERTAYKRGGYFVEFGATDGVRLSNSFLLESDFGWNGICAEPNPALFRQLQQNRQCQTTNDCIGGETGKDVDFILADAFGGIAEHAFSDQHTERRRAFQSEGGVLRLTTISLDDFLKKHGAPRTIDYLSIDTEGSEYDILRNFPFDEWDIKLITVEHNWTPMREKIEALLTGAGYRRTEAEFDDWYEKSTSDDTAAAPVEHPSATA